MATGGQNTSAAGADSGSASPSTSSKVNQDTMLFRMPDGQVQNLGDKPAESAPKGDVTSRLLDASSYSQVPGSVAEGNATAKALASQDRAGGDVRATTIPLEGGKTVPGYVQTRGETQTVMDNKGVTYSPVRTPEGTTTYKPATPGDSTSSSVARPPVSNLESAANPTNPNQTRGVVSDSAANPNAARNQTITESGPTASSIRAEQVEAAKRNPATVQLPVESTPIKAAVATPETPRSVQIGTGGDTTRQVSGDNKGTNGDGRNGGDSRGTTTTPVPGERAVTPADPKPGERAVTPADPKSAEARTTTTPQITDAKPPVAEVKSAQPQPQQQQSDASQPKVNETVNRMLADPQLAAARSYEQQRNNAEAKVTGLPAVEAPKIVPPKVENPTPGKPNDIVSGKPNDTTNIPGQNPNQNNPLQNPMQNPGAKPGDGGQQLPAQPKTENFSANNPSIPKEGGRDKGGDNHDSGPNKGDQGQNKGDQFKPDTGLTQQQALANMRAMEAAAKQNMPGQNPNPIKDAVPGQTKPGDAVPGQAKPGDAIPGQPKPGDAIPGQPKPGDLSQIANLKPGEQLPGKGQIDGQALKGALADAGALALGKDGKPLQGAIDNKVDAKGDLAAGVAKLAAMLGPDGKPLAPLDATKTVDVKAQPVLDAKTIANLDPKAVEALLKGQTAEAQTKAGSLETGKVLEAGKTNALDATTKGLDAAKGVNVNATTAALEVAAQLGKNTVADKAQAGAADAQSKAEGALKAEQGKLDATTAAKTEALQNQQKLDALVKPDPMAKLEPILKPESNLKAETNVKAESNLKPETNTKPETANKAENNKGDAHTAKVEPTGARAETARTEAIREQIADRIELANAEGADDSWTKKETSEDGGDNGRKLTEDEKEWELKEKKKRDSEESKLEEEQKNNARNAMILAMMNQKKQDELAEKERQFLIDEAKRKGEDKRRRYVVKDKDTLESIAKKQLRDVRLSALIYEINKHMLPVRMEKGKQVVDPRPGTSIWLPSESEIREFRGRLYAAPRQTNIGPPTLGKPPGKQMTAEEELSARFGSGWDGSSAGGPNSSPAAGMLGAAVAKNQTRRSNIEKVLGPMTSKQADGGRIKYIVRLSDTLDGVAAKHPALKDAELWPLLARVNDLSEECDDDFKPVDALRRGTMLNLPTPTEIALYREEVAEMEAQLEESGAISPKAGKESKPIEEAMKGSVSQVLSASQTANMTQLMREYLAPIQEAERAAREAGEDDQDYYDDEESESSENFQEDVESSENDVTADFDESADQDMATLQHMPGAQQIPAPQPEAIPENRQPFMKNMDQTARLSTHELASPVESLISSVFNPPGNQSGVPTASLPSPATPPADNEDQQFTAPLPAQAPPFPANAAPAAPVSPVGQGPAISPVPAVPVVSPVVPQASGPVTTNLPAGAEILQTPPTVSGDRLMWELKPGIRLVKSCLRWDPAIGVFRAQLEMLISGVWYPVIFFEVFPQYAVRHEYAPGGKRKSVRIDLPPATVQELADNDLVLKWPVYCRNYLAMISGNA